MSRSKDMIGRTLTYGREYSDDPDAQKVLDRLKEIDGRVSDADAAKELNDLNKKLARFKAEGVIKNKPLARAEPKVRMSKKQRVKLQRERRAIDARLAEARRDIHNDAPRTVADRAESIAKALEETNGEES